MSTSPPARMLSRHTLVRRLAGQVRRAYVEQRRLWASARSGDQSRYQPSARAEESFVKIAETVLDHEIADYHAFLNLQFTARGSRSMCVEPWQCYGPAALQRWQAWYTGEELRNEVRLSLQTSLARYETEVRRAQDMAADMHWSTDRAVQFVLTDTNNDLPVLFRYSQAAQHGLTDVMDAFAEGALMSYLFARQAYDEIWGEFVPAGLRQEAAAIRRQLSATPTRKKRS